MLAILTTHPIQYQTPLWQELARRKKVDFEVWYLSEQGARASKDQEFGQVFQWDIDMLAGYDHRLLCTTPNPPDLASFRGARIGSLKRLFAERGVSALWINGWQVQAYWQAAFQASMAGLPVWLRGESNDLGRTQWLKRLPKRLLLQMLFGRISRFLYIGSANKRLYQHYGITQSKLVPAPYCVDTLRFGEAARYWEAQRADIRQRWQIPEGATCFLFSGKFIEKKRPADILDAFIACLREYPKLGTEGKIHLLMAGEGSLRPVLEQKARILAGICGSEVVSFSGFLNQTEIPKAYVASDCLILPSDTRETWGLVVNEALACGRPSIVSDQCGCAEDLAKPLGKDFVYPCGDVNALAMRIARMARGETRIDERERYRRLSEQYGMSITIESVEKLYSELYKQR